MEIIPRIVTAEAVDTKLVVQSEDGYDIHIEMNWEKPQKGCRYYVDMSESAKLKYLMKKSQWSHTEYWTDLLDLYCNKSLSSLEKVVDGLIRPAPELPWAVRKEDEDKVYQFFVQGLMRSKYTFDGNYMEESSHMHCELNQDDPKVVEIKRRLKAHKGKVLVFASEYMKEGLDHLLRSLGCMTPMFVLEYDGVLLRYDKIPEDFVDYLLDRTEP